MAVREFDGADDYIQVGIGGIGDLSIAPYSIAMLVKPIGALTNGEPYFTIGTAATNIMGLFPDDGGIGSLVLGGDVGADSFGAGARPTLGDWQIIGLSYADASTLPRFHRKQLGVGSWTHANGNVNKAMNSGSPTRCYFGRWPVAGGITNMRVVWAAVWYGAALSDLNFEDIERNASTDYVLRMDPTALWELDQSAITVPVWDAMPGHADQVAILDTTVVTGDDPAWTFKSPYYTKEIAKESSLGSYWHLHELASPVVDYGPNGFDGTFNNNVLDRGMPSLLPGYADLCTNCDEANDDGVNFGDIYDFAGAEIFSVEIWIRPTGFPGGADDRFVIQKRDSVTSGGWSVHVNNVGFDFTRHDGAGGSDVAGGGVTPVVGSVYHLVATYDGSDMRLYVNGANPGGSTASTRSLPSTTADLRIGQASGGGSAYDGDLDEFAIYNMPLSLARIQDHYQAGIAAGIGNVSSQRRGGQRSRSGRNSNRVGGRF